MMFGAIRRGPPVAVRLLRYGSSARLSTNAGFARSLIVRTAPRALVGARGLHSSQYISQGAAEAVKTEDVDVASLPTIDRPPELGPPRRFQELSDRNMVSGVIVKTLTNAMGLDTMTEVQSLTINETLKGHDVVAQAKTGTGKTLAFLVPLLQNVLEDPNLERRNRFGAPRTSASDIRAMIISPTRELAEQIAAEAVRLTGRTNVRVQTAVGGTQKKFHLHKMKREGCHILVGTPGRIRDIFSDPYAGIEAPKLTALVFDEADRLLESGFQEEIDDIVRMLPDPKQVDRQTMMFSATMPREVMRLAANLLKPNFKFLRTVHAGETPVHERIPQKIVKVNGFENKWPALLELVEREIVKTTENPDAPPFKAIVFFGSTSEASVAAAFFDQFRIPLGGQRTPTNSLFRNVRAYEIHGQLSQAQRTYAADTFRNSKSAILFASDVVARGMDFPNVTHVIQMSTPRDHDTYIHRIGRTGRGDKSGEGWLLAADIEYDECTRLLKDVPIKPDSSLQTAKINMSKEQELVPALAEKLKSVEEAMEHVPRYTRLKAYLGLIGQYGWCRDKQALLTSLENYSRYGLGFVEPPPLPSSVKSLLEGRGGRNGSGSWSRGNRSGHGFGGRRSGFSDRRSRSFNDEGFSDRKSRSFDRGGFSDRKPRSFDAEGFSDRKPSSFNAEGFSDRKPRSFDAEGFSDRRPRSFDRGAFSDRRSRSADGEGFGGRFGREEARNLAKPRWERDFKRNSFGDKGSGFGRKEYGDKNGRADWKERKQGRQDEF